jgi:hypothetical protein
MEASRTTTSRTAIAIAAFVAILGFATVVALSAGDAAAKSAKVIGKTKKTPNQSCPGERCKIVVSVTAIQTIADGHRGIMKVPANGHIVAWSVDLGTVDTKEQPNLTEEQTSKYGEPKARLAVLKPKKKHKFKLTKQSPKMSLSSRLGETPIYTLRKPLKVKKGLRIGLTMPGWAPDFEWGLPSGDDQWIASRKDGTCSEKEAPDAKPQQKKGSVRPYGCRFKGERVLYWAYFVPNGGKKNN